MTKRKSVLTNSVKKGVFEFIMIDLQPALGKLIDHWLITEYIHTIKFPP